MDGIPGDLLLVPMAHPGRPNQRTVLVEAHDQDADARQDLGCDRTDRRSALRSSHRPGLLLHALAVQAYSGQLQPRRGQRPRCVCGHTRHLEGYQFG